MHLTMESENYTFCSSLCQQWFPVFDLILLSNIRPGVKMLFDRPRASQHLRCPPPGSLRSLLRLRPDLRLNIWDMNELLIVSISLQLQNTYTHTSLLYICPHGDFYTVMYMCLQTSSNMQIPIVFLHLSTRRYAHFPMVTYLPLSDGKWFFAHEMFKMGCF